jgi:Flp pilus assembly protein TadD
MPPTPDKLAQVRELLAAGRLEAAKSQLQRVLRQLPRDPHANNLLSAILTREGQHQSALYYAQKACETVPDHPSLLQTLGNLQALTGSREDGMRTLRRAISLSPGDPELRLSLAKVMMVSGELRAGPGGMRDRGTRGGRLSRSFPASRRAACGVGTRR